MTVRHEQAIEEPPPTPVGCPRVSSWS
jgi:hypothetical protein